MYWIDSIHFNRSELLSVTPHISDRLDGIAHPLLYLLVGVRRHTLDRLDRLDTVEYSG